MRLLVTRRHFVSDVAPGRVGAGSIRFRNKCTAAPHADTHVHDILYIRARHQLIVNHATTRPRLKPNQQSCLFQQPTRHLSILPSTMADKIYISDTPDEVSGAKGLHLLTMSTPNGQAVQILLEELADAYGTQWTTTLIDIMTNDQKKEWFLRLNPNGRIPVLVDNNQSPPFTVHETSAELLYLLKFADKEDRFGFKDDLERNQCLQWVMFWHGSGAPYQGNLGWFKRQKEQNESKFISIPQSSSTCVLSSSAPLSTISTTQAKEGHSKS